MQQHGNTTTFNIENVLTQNIINSDYYRRQCVDLNTWEEVVDEIFDSVTHVEPWMSGNARGPSSAFCLMYRLAQIKPTEEEVDETIRCNDSPYIRAVGFLYLRYVCDPKELWSWCERFVNDKENFSPSGTSQTVTMGDYVRDILLEQNYFETIFPRIPKKVLDDITASLRARNLPYVPRGNGGQGGPDRRGSDEPNRRPASVKASLSVAFGQRAPNRAGTKEDTRARVHDRRPSPVRGEGTKPDRDREQERARDRGSSRDRYRQRSPVRRDSRRSRSRSPARRDRERERDARRERPRSRDRQHQRSRSMDGDRRRSRSSSRDRDRREERPSKGGRDARDVFKEAAGGAQAADVKAKYGDASGKLFDDRGSRGRERGDEVYRLGSRYGW